MKPLPLPVRLAAGLAVTAVERARELPAKIAGLPVTVASQALQLSMRVQQQVTELAIKGDEALAMLRPVEEQPEWATFDEDLEDDTDDVSRPAPFDRVDSEPADVSGNGFPLEPPHDAPDPWAAEERALAEETFDTTTAEPERGPGPAGIAGYDELSLPQLRARLRTFSVAELEELLEHERTHANRPSFVGMLTRRIATVRDHR
jgi:hypothetical protein